MTAYDVQTFLVTAPDWLATERYDIVAKVPAGATKAQVNVMWQNLLKERVSIRDMVTILETLADHARNLKDTDLLTEYVRQALFRTITKAHLGPDNTLHALTLDPQLEQTILEAVQRGDRGTYLALDPRTRREA